MTAHVDCRNLDEVCLGALKVSKSIIYLSSMIAIEQTRVALREIARDRLFVIGIIVGIFFFFVIFSTLLIVQSEVAPLYKMVAIFISTIIYANIISGVSVVYLQQKKN